MLLYERCICWSVNYDEICSPVVLFCFFVIWTLQKNIRYPYGKADCEWYWKQLDRLSLWLCRASFHIKAYVQKLERCHVMLDFQGHIQCPFFLHCKMCKPLSEVTSTEYVDWNFSVSSILVTDHHACISYLYSEVANIWRVTRMAVWADVIG